MIYNGSVLFWKYARSFMKTNYKKYLCYALEKITKTFKEIDDPDYEWRVFLEKTLIESYLDKNQKNEAITLANQTLILIESKLNNYYDEFFEFMVINFIFLFFNIFKE